MGEILLFLLGSYIFLSPKVGGWAALCSTVCISPGGSWEGLERGVCAVGGGLHEGSLCALLPVIGCCRPILHTGPDKSRLVHLAQTSGPSKPF